MSGAVSSSSGVRPAVVAFRPGDHPPGLATLAESAEIRYGTSLEELRVGLPGAEVLFVADFRSRMLRDVWSYARDLQWIHVSGAGVDAVLFPELVNSSISLTNARGIFERAMAEYVLGLLLAFAKGFPRTIELQRHHVWQHRETERVDGRTVLAVGAGSIGREIGRFARAVGMRVLSVARRPREADPDFECVMAIEDLRTILPEAEAPLLNVVDKKRGYVPTG